MEMGEQNAKLALASRLASRSGMQSRIEALQAVFHLEELPQRLECVDVSHTSGI